jgi:hypothetical protein
MLPRDYVNVVENAQVVAEGALSALLWEPGDDEFVELLMHPDEMPGFVARFYPTALQERLN